MERYAMFFNRKTQYCSIKLAIKFFRELQLILKLICRSERSTLSKINLNKEQRIKDPTRKIGKYYTFYKVIIEITQQWHKKKQTDVTEQSETAVYIRQFIHMKAAFQINEKKQTGYKWCWAN